MTKQNKKVLYVAYHFPPIQISSGLHRTLANSRYLSENGWNVTVLTVQLKAYQSWADENLTLIPKGVAVLRAWARDTSKSFSIKGRYPGLLALPDRWQSWILGAVWTGFKYIKQQKPDLIISTYPIASAHIIGYLLHKLTGVKWVADFRDPMLQDTYPSNPKLRKVFAWIEKKVVKHCQSVIFTTSGAKEIYKNRFPHKPDDFWKVLPNGYDKHLFDEVKYSNEVVEHRKQVQLLHSGTIYPSERDPNPLFQAIAQLKADDINFRDNFHLVLRSSGHDSLYQPILDKLGIADMVSLEPAYNYTRALEEMLSVDALLLLQASNCNQQIPAKAYEYIRAKRPILALTDPQGDTAEVMRQAKCAQIAPLDNCDAIKNALLQFIHKVQNANFEYLDEQQIESFSRQHRAGELAELLEKLV